MACWRFSLDAFRSTTVSLRRAQGSVIAVISNVIELPGTVHVFACRLKLEGCPSILISRGDCAARTPHMQFKIRESEA